MRDLDSVSAVLHRGAAQSFAARAAGARSVQSTIHGLQNSTGLTLQMWY